MNGLPFDHTMFTASKAKPLPVIFLLDVSASMEGDKILNLNDAARDMLETFSDMKGHEVEIHVAIITFGAEVRLHQPLADSGSIQWRDLSADGATPLGGALRMAKAMIEDKNAVPSRAYRPTVVLVSDGQPNDSGWEQALDDFIGEGRSAKCDRMAMAIGSDADEEVLKRFIAGAKHPLFHAENAKDLRRLFKYVTMSVVIRTKSQTPNIVPDESAVKSQLGATSAAPPKSSGANGHKDKW